MGSMHLAKVLGPVVKQAQVFHCLLFFLELTYVSNCLALQPCCARLLLPLLSKAPDANLPAIRSELLQRQLQPPAPLE